MSATVILSEVALSDRKVSVQWSDSAGKMGTTVACMDLDSGAWYVVNTEGEEPDYEIEDNLPLADMIEKTACEAYTEEYEADAVDRDINRYF